MRRAHTVPGVLICAALQACTTDSETQVTASRGGLRGGEQPVVVTAACDIIAAVDEYRTLLGALNPNVVGEQPGGRREINWDAVPADQTNTDRFPADFFNQPVAGRARGVVFSTNGTGFRVSDNDFADVNPDYADQFSFFSPIRTFSAVGSPDTNVDFFVAGTDTRALSAGFGVVFSDVDNNGSASIKLIAANGSSLGKYHAPRCSGGLSFVGVALSSPVIARVEISAGKGPLSSNAADISDRDRGPARDLVIMDDFLYGEPRAPR